MLKKKNLGGTVGVCALVLACSLGLGAIAFGSSAQYSAQLPGFQGNVTIATGAKTSISSIRAVTSPASIGTGKAWQWLDDTSGRASDSVLTYSGSNSFLDYYNTTVRGGISLRACTDGWTEPTWINGYVNFG